jgi:hypothetical protein
MGRVSGRDKACVGLGRVSERVIRSRHRVIDRVKHLPVQYEWVIHWTCHVCPAYVGISE